jgi:hypothetical protein
MEPKILGEKYDKIAHLWHEQHDNSAYGVAQFKKALGFASAGGRAVVRVGALCGYCRPKTFWSRVLTCRLR